jgi:hypothetical protein
MYVSFTFSVWCVFATPNLFLKWSNSVIALKTIISHDITHSFNIQWNHIMLCIMLMQWLSLTTRAAAGMNSLWDMQYRIIIMGFVASFHLSVLFTWHILDSCINSGKIVNDTYRGRKKTWCRFAELKSFHGIEDEKPTSSTSGPQKMASGLISTDLEL